MNCNAVTAQKPKETRFLRPAQPHDLIPRICDTDLAGTGGIFSMGKMLSGLVKPASDVMIMRRRCRKNSIRTPHKPASISP